MKPKKKRKLLFQLIYWILTISTFFGILWIAIFHDDWIIITIPWLLFVVYFCAKGGPDLLRSWEEAIRHNEPLPKDLKLMK